MNFTRQSSYYLLLLLFPLIFLLHNINENFGLIPWPVPANLLVRYVLIAVFLAVLSALLFRRSAKAFLFTFLLMVIYFFFGAFKDTAKHRNVSELLTGYKTLIPALALMICLLFFYLKKSRDTLQRTASMLAVILLANGCFEVGWILYNCCIRADRKQDFGDQAHTLVRNYTPAGDARKPAVFWLLFDQYAASSTLKKVWQFDNPLDAALQAKGFFVAGHARSNYNYTPYSITSILDMTYLKGLRNHTIVTAKDMARGAYSISDNNVVRLFEKEGYRIKNYSIFNVNNHPSRGLNPLGYVPEALVDLQTLGGRMYKDIGWNFYYPFITDRKKAIAVYESREMQVIDRDYDTLTARCLQEIRRSSVEQTPSCVMFHFMLTHEPFLYNADGSVAAGNGLSALKEHYISQVKYANTVINTLTDSILHHFKGKDVVIIMQGDHGYKFEEDDPLFDVESCNALYAVYCSDRVYTSWNNDMTLVNSFRIFFNKYFHTRYPLLPDTSVNLYYR